jgi:pilus assembly protein Flp/PilA
MTERVPDDRGASAVEYGLLVAAIAAVVVVILLALGGQVLGLFDKTCDAIGAKTTPASDCQ